VRRGVVLLAAGAAGLAFAAGTWAALDPARAGLSLVLAAGSLLVAAAVWLETGDGSAKEITLVAALAAVAAIGRVVCAPVPGVQPLTVVAIAAGAALGVRAGIGVGAAAAFASNLFLGQGIWTPWQMLGWAACGAAGGLLGPVLRSRVAFAVVACVLGFAFSALMDVWEWFSFFPHTWQALAVQLGRGFPFQIAHAAGNVAFALLVGPALVRLIGRYARRLRTVVVWDAGPPVSIPAARSRLAVAPASLTDDPTPPIASGGHPSPPPASSLTTNS
jgi:energy-coupling factor transport system substrate-specific component